MTAQRMWAPSQLATPVQVRALLDGDDLDDTTREALESRLAGMEATTRGVNPFRGVSLGAPDEGWWVA